VTVRDRHTEALRRDGGLLCIDDLIALNVATDLAGFRRIAPCGYTGLRMTDMVSLGAAADLQTVKDEYRRRLLAALESALKEKTNND
jgi:lipoate-protein ligase B